MKQNTKKNILAIIGSASTNSANLKLVKHIGHLTEHEFNLTIYDELKLLPHFDPEQSIHNPPSSILQIRRLIDQSDGILICTPEYVFSIPSGLKNLIEWCISTTVFSGKPFGLITASAHGQKGHDELQLIMKTAMANFTEETTLLVQGVKGKFDGNDHLIDAETITKLSDFMDAFKKLVPNNKSGMPIS